MLKRTRLGGVAGLVALVAVALLFLVPGAEAKAKAKSTLQKGKAKVAAPVTVNVAQLAAAAPTMGLLPLAPQQKPFRPTMGQEAYEQAKAAIQGQAAPKPQTAPGLAPDLAPAFPPTLTAINFDGDNNTGWYPPDTTGAVGRNHYCQIVNSRFSVYDKTGALLLRVPINNLLGYFGSPVVDPQVMYDPSYNRWVITCMGFPEGGPATPQYFFAAVSQTSDPTGNWWVYGLNTRGLINGEFFDYPHLGQDSRSIIVTANNFQNAGPFIDSRFFAWPKARLYNGLDFGFNYWIGWPYGTIAPPIVLDMNRWSYLVSAAANDNQIRVIPMYQSSTPSETVATFYSVGVPAYTVPPNARQPGTVAVLDTLDSRFVMASTQVGNSLFQAHTVQFAASIFPAPKFYEFILTPFSGGTLNQWSFWWASGVSHDFNVSIAANRLKDVFVTWTSTNPTYGINAQVRFGGRRNFADLGTIAVSGASAGDSATYYDYPNIFYPLMRWGDYSCVTIDPSGTSSAYPYSGLTAWITNENILSSDAGGWGSRIAKITYVP